MKSRVSKTYLGDSVYVELEESTGMIRLFTHDGLTDKQVIWLEPEVWSALVQWKARLGEGEPANDQ